MKERRGSLNRILGTDWGNLSEAADINKAVIIDSVESLPAGITVAPLANFNNEQQKYFLQFAFVPLIKGDEHGLLVCELFTRVPRFILDSHLDFLVYSSKDVCNKILLEDFLPPSSSRIKETDAPLSFIEHVVAKMEELSASDVTFSWRKKNVSIMYSAGNNNMKSEEDVISSDFAEKVRVAVINLTYGRPSEPIVDGKFFMQVFGEKREYRLSVLPTVSGYSIVIRSYQKFNKNLMLSDLGYMEKPRAIIENIIENNSHGLFLLTGPTGSGKTTTIYTLIQEMNAQKYLKIKTAEDPVEIQLDGIDQCQVNNHGLEEHRITYSRLLKSFMRQKPDVIVVGEIRDAEVASAAIEASLTGHMVISTLHTGNVETTFSRLTTALNIGIDQIEDALIGILNQRLVPKLCDCKIKSGAKHFKRNEEGCEKCKKAGTIGYNKEVIVCEIAALNRGFENYKKTNYKEYYSYDNSGKDLYDLGIIDLLTYNFVKKIS